MAIERALPSQTLEEMLAALQTAPSETDEQAPLAEVSEVAILPEAAGDAASISIPEL